jgi:hypothetical protein
METNVVLACLALIAPLATQEPPAPAAARPPVTVAVLDFQCEIEGTKDLGAQIASALAAHLSKEEDMLTVERAELDEILSEQELGRSGLVEPGTAAVVGRLTGAKVLVTGRVFVAGDEFLVVSKVIGTETSRVFGDVAKIGTQRSPADLGEEMARKTAVLVREKRAQLLAREETHDERRGRCSGWSRSRSARATRGGPSPTRRPRRR